MRLKGLINRLLNAFRNPLGQSFAEYSQSGAAQASVSYSKTEQEQYFAREVPDIDPWRWLAPYKDSEIYWANKLREQFPSRLIVPFAKHAGSDDVACFDGSDTSSDPKVLYIHAFCASGWERRGEASNFTEWLRKSQIEAAEFEADDDPNKNG